ncbi:MAG: DUF1189 domain-containing protein [Lachnospiraceae bacterium]
MKDTLRDIWYALTRPDAYREFITYKKGRIFLYILFVTLISYVCATASTAVAFIKAGGLSGIMNENIPKFSISAERGLWIEEPVLIDEYNLYVEIDPEKTYEDITDPEGENVFYGNILIADSEKMYFKSEGVGAQTIYYEDLTGIELNNETLDEMIPIMYAAAAAVLLISFLIDAAYYFLMAYMVACFAHLMAKIMKMNMAFRPVLNMSIYARTVVQVISVIITIAGISIPHFYIFSIIIAMGYMYFALKDYREYLTSTGNSENREG